MILIVILNLQSLYCDENQQIILYWLCFSVYKKYDEIIKAERVYLLYRFISNIYYACIRKKQNFKISYTDLCKVKIKE